MAISYWADLSPPIPKRLVLFRHEESWQNRVNLLFRKGDRVWHQRIIALPDSAISLTDTGMSRCLFDGDFIRARVGPRFDAYCVSPSLRAIQTAYGLGFVGAEWIEREELTERREAYRQDILSVPKAHEPSSRVRERLLKLLSDYQDCDNLLCVTHSHTIVEAMALLEDWTCGQYLEHFREMENSASWLYNGHVVEYSRVNPLDPADVRPTYCWVRSACPWKQSSFNFNWREIAPALEITRGDCQNEKVSATHLPVAV